ncbi:phytoene desaturase [Dyadobacter jejuensis]|uniref:Phytoene desaturase n=1 Tax=Dyadobacter jejuensis TaxID=1082580 RepID=A0A316AQL9_9BACT|nr:phytoene desaturase family protein [Dyadobacter jejuensis]PWJ59070.1 phytoene desaturase [Dyadobacter jejuensis]
MIATNKAIVLGSGFAGMAGAALLAKNGLDVTVIEKNTTSGGRGRVFEDQGYRFDMGPSWYWMPDVYEQYYNEFGYTTADFYELKKLDPGFAVIFGQNEVMDIPADFEEICTLFESYETGAAEKLRRFIADGAYKYQVGMGEMVFQPAHSVIEFMKVRLLKDALKLQLLSSFKGHVREYFKDPRLLALMEFPVLFLGALPKNTPAMYSLMNFAGLKQGTFYPMGGFGRVAETFQKIAEEQGVKFKFQTDIHSIQIKDNRVVGLQNINDFYPADILLGTADYAHIERMLLPKSHRSYPTSYWDKRTFAPSALIFYLGINKKLEGLRHHNLFFEESFDQHAHDIYKDPKWPKNPLFYACCPSRTDESVAPAGKENLFLLMPLAIGLADSPSLREEYFEMLMERLEKFAGEPIREFIDYKKSYCINNFINDYNAYKGNAYGLANTLRQTAFLKPKMRSQKVSNLYYAGQLTVPGPGVPPTIISGQIAAKEILKHLN